ncbi:cation:proton antiporter [Aquibacillus koreensis]|uniref:Cation:proton antiporter n=1 Tax=Aquibacillus koreensis TaxID=279446 RepID=A0A9X3WNN2_9BACI|nr:cation:proton antiporter [Aquibacillus koreensis]MCT2536738.1 cation:proton antiporter [Aquibacillus koreensis]MDC3421506.1 cation:proton antiporter [Aquibacillus koreensis]
MNIPLQEPVLIFGLAVLIFLFFPILMGKLRIPSIIGPIVAGIIIGPNGLELLARDQTIELLGTVGLLFIIFIAGLELDIDGFKKYRNRSILFGLLSFSFPLILATIVGLWLGFSMPAAILLGSIVGSHTLLGFPAVSRLGITKNKAVTTALGGTLLTDTLAMLVLAVVTGVSKGNVGFSFWMTLIIATTLFAAGTLLITPYLSKWFFKSSNNEAALEFNFVMAILFVSGAIALFVGLQPIIGAFLAGLALNRYIYDHGPLMNRIRFTGNALFIPFFLLSVGMLMDLRVLATDPSAWIVTALVIGTVVVGKALASWVTSKIYGYSRNENRVIFGLSISQAAATLASTLVGYQMGLLNQQTVNAVIVMILLTCILGPYFSEKYGRKLATSQDKKVIDESLPERILIPLANPNTMESLLDLGFVMKKAKKTEEPLYPLTVVQKDLKQASNEVAQAERMLGHTVMYASGADVSVKLLTRVDRNIGWGIERAVTEERITTIIAGWNGASEGSKKVFGSIIDNFLEHTYQRTLITNIGQPLSTMERLILIFPNNVIFKPGFEDSISIIKDIASQLNTEVVGLVVRDQLASYEKVSERIRPGIKIDFKSVESWEALYERELDVVKANDLIILISARRGTVAWHPELEALPSKIISKKHGNLIVFYPTEMKETDIRGARGTVVPKELLFKRDYD